MGKTLNLNSLLRERAVFEKVRIGMVDERDQMGASQAFEFCYELSWKALKNYLEVGGIKCSTPREVFREASVAGLIKDPAIWFRFQELSNMASHTYEISNLEALVA